MHRPLSTALLFLLVPFAASTGCQGLPGCRVNVDCAAGEFCQNGSCQLNPLRGCNADSDCAGGQFCGNSTCQPDCLVQGCPQADRCDSDTHRCVTLVYSSPPDGGTGGSTGGTPAPFCSSCADSGCGPVTSLCQQDARGFAFCGTDCSGGMPCPADAQCLSTSQFNPNTGARIHNCFPLSFLCQCEPTTDTWSNYAEAFFTTNCQSCHVQYPMTLAMYQFTSYENVVQVSPDIQTQVGYGFMPQSPISLTQDEQVRILNWLDCGMPE